MMSLRFGVCWILLCWLSLFTSLSGQETATVAAPFSSITTTLQPIENDDEDNEGEEKPSYDYDEDYDQQAATKNETNLKTGIVYTWDKWPKWNKCSRPCGGGVQTRIRNCIEKKQIGSQLEIIQFQPGIEGRKGCFGILKKFRMCNQKACPKADNIRNQQCAAHNEIPYQEKLYNWEGYIKEHHECEQNCKPVDRDVYKKFSKSVIDGTPCTMPAVYYTHSYRGRAVCVEGICKIYISRS